MAKVDTVSDTPSSGSKNKNDTDERSGRTRKRRCRWGAEEDRAVIPGVPTIVDQLEVENLNQQIRTGIYSEHDLNRSPSPEPIYSFDGKRLNTKELRYKDTLEVKRNGLIDKIIKLNPLYRPPTEYKQSTQNRIVDKVFIPQDMHPGINFVGLIIGPRGNTLKMLEKETGCKIIIRGKGSVKEGKLARPNGIPLPGEDEPLHAYITAGTADLVQTAVKRVKSIVKDGIEVPQCSNDLRKQQLRELALLNGTLRETEGISRLKQLEEAQTIVTNTIFCSKCGGAGHLSYDCLVVTDTSDEAKNPMQKAQMDTEYMSLMAELGQNVTRSTVAFNSIGAGTDIAVGAASYCLPMPNNMTIPSNQLGYYATTQNSLMGNFPVQIENYPQPAQVPPPPPAESIAPPPPPAN